MHKSKDNKSVDRSPVDRFTKRFIDIWTKAEKRNNTAEDFGRFHRIYSVRSSRFNHQYIVMGIYDSVTHKYVTFDTVNMVGNYRYTGRGIPGEFKEMNELVSQ